MTNRTAPRDFTAEYVAARKAVRSTTTLADRGAAARKAAAILRAAQRAGVELNEVALDEQARLELAPVARKVERIVGYSVAGLPIWG